MNDALLETCHHINTILLFRGHKKGAYDLEDALIRNRSTPALLSVGMRQGSQRHRTHEERRLTPESEDFSLHVHL